MNIEILNKQKLEDILHKFGYLPIKNMEKEAWYLSPFREETQPSFKINKINQVWFDHGEGTGGKNIDFLIRYFGITVKETLAWAREQSFSFQQQNRNLKTKESNIRLVSVAPLENYYLKKYLTQRGISNKCYHFLHEVKFTNNSKKYYAIGFKNNSGGFELRNSFYKGCILKKDITTIQNNSETILLFEGFFDFISAIELKRKFTEDAVILNSIAMLDKAKQKLKKYKKIKLFLDRDRTGIDTTNKILKEFPQAIDYSCFYSEYKDLNEYLSHNKSTVSF